MMMKEQVLQKANPLGAGSQVKGSVISICNLT